MQTAQALGVQLGRPNFVTLIRKFLYGQLHADSNSTSSEPSEVSATKLPSFHEKIRVHFSAVATFYAPSDISGVGGMRRERIRAVSSWRGGPARHDCAFVETNAAFKGMRGLDIIRIRLLFSFVYNGITYPCALIQWYSRIGDGPDENTGMWVVEPDRHPDGSPREAVIHLDCILRAAHLIGVYGNGFLPPGLTAENSLDSFTSYFVNKFVDHHAFEIAF
jgi:hypothetical protein